MEENRWAENVMLVDADYVDSVAFDLTVNFERMLGRRVPQADMARWTECVALDGGLREGEHEVMVLLVHDRQRKAMNNFVPGNYEEELHGMAFKGRLGEFSFTAVQTEAMAGKEDLLADLLEVVCTQAGVKRLMVVAAEPMLDTVRRKLRQYDSEERHTTVFVMQPVQGGTFRQELLGYSLMAALGISGKEIEEKMK